MGGHSTDFRKHTVSRVRSHGDPELFLLKVMPKESEEMFWGGSKVPSGAQKERLS